MYCIWEAYISYILDQIEAERFKNQEVKKEQDIYLYIYIFEMVVRKHCDLIHVLIITVEPNKVLITTIC